MHAHVGTYRPNAFGLHDVHGNVWEWCQDWSVAYGREPRIGDGLRGARSAHYRIFRGGSFFNGAHRARSAGRFSSAPSLEQINLGLRPAKVIL